MPKRNLLFIASAIIILLLLAGCGGFSLAEDVTPPPNAESYSAQDTPVPNDSTFPIVPADPSQGEAIYAEKCAECHGDTGLGDGPQASQLPVPVTALADANVAFKAKPSDWFTIVTKGNLEKYMPGFQSLDDRQRWDVVAYALTLSMKGADIGQGQLVYQEKCQSCHGESGQGSQAAPNWQKDATRLAQYSLEDIANVTSKGINSMPGFAGDLDTVDLQSVAVYTRMLGFSNVAAQTVTADQTSAATPAPTTIPTPAAPSIVTIQGKVTNASGGALPDGLQATLTGYEGMNVESKQTTQVNNGAYQFDQVEVVSGDTYVVTIDYQGLTFSSDVYHTSTAPEGNSIDLPIDFYDTTSDIAALRADRMHIFFDFTNPESVQVVELFILNNTGNRVIIPSEVGKGIISYELPTGATNLQFEDGTIGERYLQTDRGFADTANISPGTGQQVLFAYNLPYVKKMSIEVPIPLDVDAAIVMVPAGTMKLTSDQLQSAGQQDVQGTSLDLYTSSSLTKGSILTMSLSGSSNSGLALKIGNKNGLLIGAASLGVVLLGVGYWLLRRRQSMRVLAPVDPAPAQESAEDLMDAIIALDDRYKAGDIPDDAYQNRRQLLKDQLKSKMN